MLLHGLCKANPTFLQTFGAILTKIIEGGSENESQLLGLLLSGKPNGPEILTTFRFRMVESMAVYLEMNSKLQCLKIFLESLRELALGGSTL